MDHGLDAKMTLYENGIRMVQLVHYPDAFGTDGLTFDGPVSTIDIAPTFYDYAGLDSSSYYELDGISWREAVLSAELELQFEEDRCLYFEMQFDRAAKCGCFKYIVMNNNTSKMLNTLSDTMVRMASQRHQGSVISCSKQAVPPCTLSLGIRYYGI